MKPEIIIKKTNDLIPYVNNARTHSDEQVLQIAASIKEFGFNNPVLIDKESGIIAGHGRVLAAKKLGLEDVPCIVLGHLTAGQRKAFILADNKIALNSGWDEEKLKLEIEEIKSLGVDIGLLGFESGELKEISPDVEGLGKSEDESEFGIYIKLESELDQKQVFEEMEARGFECKIMN